MRSAEIAACFSGRSRCSVSLRRARIGWRGWCRLLGRPLNLFGAGQPMHAKTRGERQAAAPLAHAKEGFNRWRKRSNPRQRIPDRLWRMPPRPPRFMACTPPDESFGPTPRGWRSNYARSAKSASELSEQVRWLGRHRFSRLRKPVGTRALAKGAFGAAESRTLAQARPARDGHGRSCESATAGTQRISKLEVDAAEGGQLPRNRHTRSQRLATFSRRSRAARTPLAAVVPRPAGTAATHPAKIRVAVATVGGIANRVAPGGQSARDVWSLFRSRTPRLRVHRYLPLQLTMNGKTRSSW